MSGCLDIMSDAFAQTFTFWYDLFDEYWVVVRFRLNSDTISARVTFRTSNLLLGPLNPLPSPYTVSHVLAFGVLLYFFLTSFGPLI